MQDRASKLTASLSPAEGDDRRKAVALSTLFLSLGGAPSTPAASEAKAMVYLDVLAKIPAWAVEAGAMMWMRGESLADGDNAAFVPNPPQLIRMARKAMEPTYREIAEMKRLASAKPYHQPSKLMKEQVDAVLEQHGFKAKTQAGAAT
jgi:hypothetical protein